MQGIVYLLKTTFINYFKRFKKQPQKAIGPFFVVFWFFIIILSYKSKKSTGIFRFEYFMVISLIYILAIMLYALYNGTKKLSSNFEMNDVNLLFVSPIKPQTILLYGIVKKLWAEIFAMFYIIVQIPNFIRNASIPILNVVILIVSVIFYQAVFCNLLKLFIFSLNTKFKKLGERIRFSIKLFIGLAAVFLIYVFVKGNVLLFINSLVKVITYNKFIGYIPVFGWMREILYYSIKGINFYFWMNIFLFVLTSIIMLYIIYNLNLDYYEDVLTGAEQLTNIKNISKNKEQYVSNNKNIFTKSFKKKELNLKNAYGAKVLFYKHINEYVKRSPIFFINIYSIILFLASVILGIFAKGVDVKIIFLASSVLLIFSAGMAGKIFTEIYSHFIFMIPDTPQRKLIYGTASSLVKSFSDSILLFVPFGILSGKSFIEIFLCIVCYVLLAAMLSYSGVFAFRVSRFIGFDGDISQAIFFIFFQFFILAGLYIVINLVTLGFKYFNGYTIYLSYILYSFVFSILSFIGGIGIFKDTEF
ncbi:MAG: putative ABC exporter domain-containing protein [Caloramator sp.]|nr:putative ABC exporter domain-containing protein [Caloramator sp.]